MFNKYYHEIVYIVLSSITTNYQSHIISFLDVIYSYHEMLYFTPSIYLKIVFMTNAYWLNKFSTVDVDFAEQYRLQQVNTNNAIFE